MKKKFLSVIIWNNNEKSVSESVRNYVWKNAWESSNHEVWNNVMDSVRGNVNNLVVAFPYRSIVRHARKFSKNMNEKKN
jgi:hypothetical protein